jgi:hypothetical protein
VFIIDPLGAIHQLKDFLTYYVENLIIDGFNEVNILKNSRHFYEANSSTGPVTPFYFLLLCE